MRLINMILGGALLGATAVVYTISFFAIVFTGDLAVHIDAWIGPVLIGGAVMAVVGGLSFSYRGTVMHPQDVPAAIFSVAAAKFALDAPEASPDVLVGTILAMIAVTTIAAGVVALLLGRARMSYIVHAIPYPVVLGFLAATGVTLILGAVAMTISETVNLWNVLGVFDPELLRVWLPWLSVSACIFLLSQRIQSSMLLPVCIGLTLAGFHVVVATGPGLESMWAAGLMLAEPGNQVSAGRSLAIYGEADWSAVAREAPLLMAIVGLTVLGGLLNLTGVRYITGRGLDLDRDLQALGLANIAGGAAGGMVGYPVVSTTFLGWRVGLHGVSAPLAAAIVCGGVGFFGAEMLTYLPKGIFAAIVGYLGLDLLVTSARSARRQLSRVDVLLFAGVLGVAATLGFLEAIALGVVAAAILFAHSAARTEVLHTRRMHAIRSVRTERVGADSASAEDRENEIVIIELTGFLFFGACSRLRALAEQELTTKDGPPDSIVVDFSRVSAIDVSAALALAEFQKNCAMAGVRLLFAGARDSVLAALKTAQRDADDWLGSHDDLDAALSNCRSGLLGNILPDEPFAK